MLISYNWLKEFVDINATPQEIDAALTMLGIEVEKIYDYSAKFRNFYVAFVAEKEKHPQADKLSVCKVELLGETHQVICGAPNVEAGQKIAFAAIGAYVPSAGFTIEKRKIRGIESQGMICSKSELELGEDSSGIWVLPSDAPEGEELAKYLGMDDIVFEISVTPNRPDALSHLGVARDLAAYYKLPLKFNEPLLKETDQPVDKSVKVVIEDSDLCPRYTARVIRNAKVGESPEWLKRRLLICGLRPINAAVDVTNYVLLEYGQPLHAFDLDKIEDNTILVKRAAQGEKFTTLDDKERELDSDALTIRDAKRAVAIGGVMGGANTEISGETANILLESAYFTPSSIRRTAKKLGIQSDSSYRFERGIDYANVEIASRRAASLIAELTGGAIEKGVIDVYPEPIKNKIINVRYERARKIIGYDISNEKIVEILNLLYFKILQKGEDNLIVEAPSFRVDITQEIDIIEEIARLYNYDNIEPNYYINSDITGAYLPEKLAVPPFRRKISSFLTDRGFFEIITQNQIDPKSAAYFSEKPVEIANPLGSELSIMRPSLIPSALKTIEKNSRLGIKNFRFFEIGKSFHHEEHDANFIQGIREKENLLVAIAGDAPAEWYDKGRKADFYDIKGVAEELEDLLNIKLEFSPATPDNIFGASAARIRYNGHDAGLIGELNKELLAAYDIDFQVYMAVLELDALYRSNIPERRYKPISPYPVITRDLAFMLPSSVNYGDVKTVIDSKGGPFLTSSGIFDVFEGKSLGEGKKSMAFSLQFSSPEKTLTDIEVEDAINTIVKAVEEKFEAKLRSS